MMRNSVFDEFRASRFAAIQFEIAVKVDLSESSAAEKRLGLKEMLCVVGIEVVVDRCRGDKSAERSGV